MANKKVTPGSLTDAYRRREGDFSPDLVGFQLTQGTPLFTLGNFSVTTNDDPKKDTYFNTGNLSQIYTLDNLNLTQEESKKLVSNNIFTTLNLDPSDLSRFVYYGSLVDYLRVSIEGIITKWKGSLFITDDEGGFSRVAKYTVLNYTYNSLTDTSTLTIPTLFIQNKFGLITNDLGGFILQATDISNIKLSYDNYVISNDYGEFNLLTYTGDTVDIPGVPNNPYINLTLKGEAFPTLSGSSFGTFKYHLKPKDNIVDGIFFDNLTDFENIILNRLVTPRYTSMFESPMQTDSGRLINARKTFTWPTSDGFNLDVDTTAYGRYISGLLTMAKDYDRLKSNIINRRFVANSINEFDTDDGGSGTESQSRKINKLLKIYGREFDEVKKYVDGIQFANVVTYNKKDNTPDELIKNMAKTLGFEAIQSVTNNQLISYIAKSNEIIFSGQSRSMSTQETDIELWRRLVINAWWLFKSKGHRKVVEFFIKLFGLNECLVNIDECIYVVKDKLDVEDTFHKIEEVLLRGLESGSTINIDRDLYPIDTEGFPKTLPNTPEYYFQSNGFWYNNGTQKTVGNNPHFGPYDYGSNYFNKFSCFIDDFSGRTDVITQEYIQNTNLFTDYNKGDLEITFEDGKPLQDYGTAYAETMVKNDRVSEMTNLMSAGFSTEKSRTGRGALKLTFNCGNDSCEVPCPPFDLDDVNGIVIELGNGPLDEECCKFHGFEYVPSTFSDTYIHGLSREDLEKYEDYLSTLKKIYGEQVFNDNSNLCFWCKPTISICDFGAYFETVVKDEGVNGIIQILLNDGIITQEQVPRLLEQWAKDESKLLADMVKHYNNQYDGYCLIVHEDFGEVSEECCKIRGGEWAQVKGGKGQSPKELESQTNNVKGVAAINATTDKFQCVTIKEVPPEPDPCFCELPEYCEYKKTELVNLHGLSFTEPTVQQLESTYSEADFARWWGEKNSYLLQQQQGWPKGILPLPQPVVGYEFFTGYQTWSLVNTQINCYDSYFNWVENGGVDEMGNPVTASIAPSGWSDYLNSQLEPRARYQDGDIVTIDYNDILVAQTECRDRANKAKYDLSEVMDGFLLSNEYIPYYYIQKCKLECGYGCTEQDNSCPTPTIVDYTQDQVLIKFPKSQERLLGGKKG